MLDSALSNPFQTFDGEELYPSIQAKAAQLKNIISVAVVQKKGILHFATVRKIFSNLDGEPWLVGKDITEILGYVNASKAVSVHVSEEERILKTLEADAKNGNVVSSKVPFGYFYIYPYAPFQGMG